MISFVNAKINIGLYVTGRRSDGYHDLSTVFYPVGINNATAAFPYPFGDALEVIPADSDSFITKGISAGCADKDNIVCKARELFNLSLTERGEMPGKYNIVLSKHLPNGAGLGGGSADASFTLRMLNELHGFPFSLDDLEKMAGSLGADCPIFIRNHPSFAEGKGDILSPIALDLSEYVALIVKPPLSISTREAFANVPIGPAPDELKRLATLPIEQWQGRIENAFEKSLFPRYPHLQKIRDHLLDCGAIYASMSGSGSAIYGIFSSLDSALDSKDSFPGNDVYVVAL